MSFALTKSFYEAATSTTAARTRIQFIPGDEVGVVCHDCAEACDLGLSKKTYLAIFREGHMYFERGMAANACQSRLDTLWDRYFASVAVLTTTNEHMSAWHVHEDTVWALYAELGLLFLVQESAFTMALATSKLARINKSSVLWCWIRKLFVAGAFVRPLSWTTPQFIEHILQALEVHFQNYAAGFTAAWIVQCHFVCETVANGAAGEFLYVLEMVRRRCMERVTDVSLWTLLGTLLLGKVDSNVLEDYLHIRAGLERRGLVPLPPCVSVPQVSPEQRNTATRVASELLRWLVACESAYESPYNQLLRASTIPESESLLQQAMVQTRNKTFQETLQRVHARWYTKK